MIIKLDSQWMKGKAPEIKVPSGFLVAGGAIRRWYSGEKQDSDIDVFHGDPDRRKVLATEWESMKISSTKMNATYRIAGKIVQLIELDFPNDSYNIDPDPEAMECYPEALFDKFDFHHCCWAWDGKHVYTTPEAIMTTERKHLALHHPQNGFEMDTLRRAFKYQRSGFSPCVGTLQDLVGMIRTAPDESLAHQIEYSPGGEKRKIIRYD
jgi:hypothetical protein